MTLTLILIRHCKSDWDAGIASDHARPLNPRGRRDAPLLGVWLADQALGPDMVLCSDAQRTQETWAGIADSLPTGPKPELRRELYLAEPEAMLRILHRASGACVALIAHNPGIAALAWGLASVAPDNARFGQYPTGATTILTFDAPHWSGIRPGEGHVEGFITPHDLLP